MTFNEALRNERCILTEGSVIERLRRQPGAELDAVVANAAFPYHPAKAAALASIYRQYLEIGRASALPMICLSPTWRASGERLRLAGLADRDVNGDCVRFLRRLCGEYRGSSQAIYLGGLMGCRGDAYRVEESLSRDDAREFHREQQAALSAAGVDFLLASTLPEANEAEGIALAMSAFSLPYMLSFLISASGTLLDGTPIEEVIRRIDSAVAPPPAGYLVNCVHHSIFARAVASIRPEVRARVLGLQANTSPRSPRELDGLDHLETESPEVFADCLYQLHRRWRLKILGGCCGTNDEHIRCLAGRFQQSDAAQTRQSDS